VSAVRDKAAVLFVGVDTRGSRVHDLFPLWMGALGSEASLYGVDIPLDSPPARYRELLASIVAADDVVGAVVTSHKLSLFAACHDQLVVDRFASTAREVNCVWKEGGGVNASARDSAAVSAVLATMLGTRERTEVLCLGAGGAATAIGLSLLADTSEPQHVTFTDMRTERLAALRETMAPFVGGSEVAYVEVDTSADNDARLESLPPGALVINATGLGKDKPGSPISDRASFPRAAVIWELNYRGLRPFLDQARAQRANARLQIHDGWLYFLHGWFQALAPILGFSANQANFDRLAQVSQRP
jgi:shikimate dehydrogenase